MLEYTVREDSKRKDEGRNGRKGRKVDVRKGGVTNQGEQKEEDSVKVGKDTDRR